MDSVRLLRYRTLSAGLLLASLLLGAQVLGVLHITEHTFGKDRDKGGVCEICLSQKDRKSPAPNVSHLLSLPKSYASLLLHSIERELSHSVFYDDAPPRAPPSLPSFRI